MKKGFTLVELAIVLVVIGLLMGMAFKGKSLVDAARIKADVNKVEKLGTAINVYYSKYDTLPGLSSVSGGGTTYAAKSSGAIYQTLIDEGLVKDSDFKSASGATYWTFIGCNHDAAKWAATGIAETANLCIYRSSNEPKNQKTAETAIKNASISGETICQLETLLDDKNLETGDGRQGNNINLSKVDTTNWNCADKKANSINNEALEYMYRVF